MYKKQCHINVRIKTNEQKKQVGGKENIPPARKHILQKWLKELMSNLMGEFRKTE